MRSTGLGSRNTEMMRHADSYPCRTKDTPQGDSHYVGQCFSTAQIPETSHLKEKIFILTCGFRSHSLG
jgi:hypothetical protein